MVSGCGSRVNCEKAEKDPLDPDVMGIGVLVAFVVPAIWSSIIQILAYVTRASPSEDFRFFDNKIIPRRDKKSIWSSFHTNKYQPLLLTLSDQILATSLALVVTMFSQICSMSTVTFVVGAALTYLATSVHLATLVTLRGYFNKHRRQAKVRLCLMTLAFLLFQVVAFMIERFDEISYDKPAVCGIITSDAGWGEVLWNWLAFFLWTGYTYYKSIMDFISRRESIYTVHPLLVGICRILYQDRNALADRQAFRMEEDTRRSLKWGERCLSLRSRPRRIRKTLRIVVSAVFTDFVSSQFSEIGFNIVYMSVGIYMLFSAIFDSDDINSRHLLEAKFGQMMPILLLLVFAFNIMEATGIESSSSTPLSEGTAGSATTENHNEQVKDMLLNLPNETATQNEIQTPKVGGPPSGSSEICSTATNTQQPIRGNTIWKTAMETTHVPIVAVHPDPGSNERVELTNMRTETEASETEVSSQFDRNNEVNTDKDDGDNLNLITGVTYDEYMDTVYSEASAYAWVAFTISILWAASLSVAVYFYFTLTITAKFSYMILKRAIMVYRGLQRFRRFKKEKIMARREKHKQEAEVAERMAQEQT